MSDARYVEVGETVDRKYLETWGTLAKFYHISGVEFCDLPTSTFKQVSGDRFERIE